MLTSVDPGLPNLEQFEGTEGLGRGPDHLDWVEVAGTKRPTLSANFGGRRIYTTDRMSPELFEKISKPNDSSLQRGDTERMNDITREELSLNLSAIEERMDKRIERMEYDAEKRVLDYRSELALRDEQLRRELDLRQESFRFEQTARDAALSEKFAGFLAAQAERDKSLERISEARFDRIEKDVSSIKSDTKRVSDDVNGIKVTMAKYLGAAVVIGALASAALGAAAKHLLG